MDRSKRLTNSDDALERRKKGKKQRAIDGPEWVDSLAEINIAAGRSHTKELACWILLRESCRNRDMGSGVVHISELKKLIIDAGLSQQTFERVRDGGDGLFWDLNFCEDINYIRLRGDERVAKHLHCFRPFMRKFEIKREVLKSMKLVRLRTIFYNSLFMDKMLSRTIARDTIEEKFHVKKHTQRKYERLTDIKVEEQRARVIIRKGEEDCLPIDLDRPDVTTRRLMGKKGNLVEYTWQIPNLYTCDFGKAKNLGFLFNERYAVAKIIRRSWNCDQDSGPYGSKDYTYEDVIHTAKKNKTYNRMYYCKSDTEPENLFISEIAERAQAKGYSGAFIMPRTNVKYAEFIPANPKPGSLRIEFADHDGSVPVRPPKNHSKIGSQDRVLVNQLCLTH
jgi:hypothetical protein